MAFDPKMMRNVEREIFLALSLIDEGESAAVLFFIDAADESNYVLGIGSPDMAAEYKIDQPGDRATAVLTSESDPGAVAEELINAALAARDRRLGKTP